MAASWTENRTLPRRRRLPRILVFLFTILLLANLDAVVDHFLHPAIPYFDPEHLIVGGVIGLAAGVLFGLLALYVHRLEDALDQIRTLEKFLSICAGCKKIRWPGADPFKQESWIPMEEYITHETGTLFSHGLCPECNQKLYPHLIHPEHDTQKKEPSEST